MKCVKDIRPASMVTYNNLGKISRVSDEEADRLVHKEGTHVFVSKSEWKASRGRN